MLSKTTWDVMEKTLTGWSRVFVTGVALVATFVTSPFAVTSPDFPMVGFATQNGGTTGGAGYSEVTVDNVNDLKSYAKAGNKIIYVKPGSYMGPIDVGNNVTIYGYQGAIIAQPSSGSAMKLSGSKNVIIRNLVFKGAGAHDDDDEDCLQVNHESKNVWIDHVDIYDGHDGNLDITNASDYITISWAKFSYTSASTGHQFSNLIGNDKKKTTDREHLNVTIHHSWWADGVKERMPRVRYGKVHVANNLFDSKDASHCVRAAVEANVRIEKNVFIGVKKDLDLYTSEGTITAAQMIGNYEENVKTQQPGTGTAFTPSYSMSLTDVSTKEKAYALRDSIKLYAGATLRDPNSNSTVTPTSSSGVESSSSAKSSSSSAKSSSSIASSSSVAQSSSSATAVIECSSSEKSIENSSSSEGVMGLFFADASRWNLSVSGRELSIAGVESAPVAIFDMQGRLLCRKAVGEKFVAVVPSAGRYIVQVGTESRMVEVR